jgi:hypothetical protein
MFMTDRYRRYRLDAIELTRPFSRESLYPTKTWKYWHMFALSRRTFVLKMLSDHRCVYFVEHNFLHSIALLQNSNSQVICKMSRILFWDGAYTLQQRWDHPNLGDTRKRIEISSTFLRRQTFSALIAGERDLVREHWADLWERFQLCGNYSICEFFTEKWSIKNHDG